MHCAEPKDLVHAYLDLELGLGESLEMERHFLECQTCAGALEEGRRLRARLGEASLYAAAPSELVAAVRDAIRSDARGAARWPRLARRWLAVGLPVALAAAVAWIVAPFAERTSSTERLVADLVAAHVRSLMVDHLTDVTSSDKHTVKPWFDGKLDFAPVVVDLADHGFPLLGGRLDYVAERPVAALVYGRQRHAVNVFVWPAPREGGGDAVESRHGFNLVHWTVAGESYWAVSDLNAAELEEFAALMRDRSRGHPPESQSTGG